MIIGKCIRDFATVLTEVSFLNTVAWNIWPDNRHHHNKHDEWERYSYDHLPWFREVAIASKIFQTRPLTKHRNMSIVNRLKNCSLNPIMDSMKSYRNILGTTSKNFASFVTS